MKSWVFLIRSPLKSISRNGSNCDIELPADAKFLLGLNLVPRLLQTKQISSVLWMLLLPAKCVYRQRYCRLKRYLLGALLCSRSLKLSCENKFHRNSTALVMALVTLS